MCGMKVRSCGKRYLFKIKILENQMEDALKIFEQLKLCDVDMHLEKDVLHRMYRKMI